MYLLDNCNISLAMHFRKFGVMPTDMEVWLAMRRVAPDLSEPQPSLPRYYYTTEEDYSSYSKTLQGFNPKVDEPMSVEVHENSLIVSERGRQHGRYRILNEVIQPSMTLTCVKVKEICPRGK
jgi:hypothetical protein